MQAGAVNITPEGFHAKGPAEEVAQEPLEKDVPEGSEATTATSAA